ETAISEVRPHPGESACVAEFEILDSLNIVDLRNPRKLVSPFLLTDEGEVSLLREDIEFLEKLGRELTNPVHPTLASIDYIPSQYLCEFIKKCGYNGVLYNSSVSKGMNLALFSPSNAKAIQMQSFNITKVAVEFN
ncbi:MAG: RES domain-containing protein, partial [Maribacter arcticus]|uniref:RES domain-containing protein n=1 Tax=Maribacter arcticus TaxID=561365 RepID=UPI0030018D4F